MQLRIATCRPLPEPDGDEDLLLAGLARAGVEARMSAWNDPDENWDERVPTVIRSTWDYHHEVDAFSAWCARVERSAPLWNSASIVRGNVHKRYLLELASRGVPTAPTELIVRGSKLRLAEICARRGWSDVVIKPEVGASSFATLRATRATIDVGERHLAHLLASRDVLVQPYLSSVEGHGERACVWIDGELTHAVRKMPRFSGGEERVSQALAIEPDERAVAELALAPIAHELLYARVDLARDEHGRPLLMELELVEPSLFLREHPPALQRLVAAIVRRLEQ